MNQLQPVRFYVAMLALFMAALVGATFYFIMGMGQATYVVTDGVHLTTRYLDKPHYDMHLQGLIFALSFLVAGALLVLMILIPDQAPQGRAPSADEPPQPRQRPQGAPQPAPAAAAARSAPAGGEPAAPAAAAATAGTTPHQPSPLSIEGGESEGGEAAEARKGISVEEEVLQSASTAEDLPEVDSADSRFDDAGDEDAVYGNGRITEDAVWDFVQQYPDSAVKFLYRKALDNKSLSPTEEDIYRNWEMRGMTRAKVREIVLDIMRWQSLPDSFPHEIWRALRDQIFEMRAH